MNKKLVLALLAAGALSAHAASSVEIAAGATAADIQSAIDTIDEGGTVRFPAGTWTLSATLVVNRGVTVEGAGAALTTLDFNNACSGFQISHKDAKVSKLRIYHGESTAQTSGGGVTLSNGEISECLIDSCVYKGNQYQNGGGGIRLSGGRAFRCEITGCYVDNTFGHGGAVFFREGGVVEECDIHDNIGKTGNDNISFNSATVALFKGGTLQNSKIHHNQRRTVPGVKIDTSGTVRNCLIYGNSCYDQYYNHGGGLYMTGGTVEYCTVFGNVQKESVGAEAGLFCSGGTVKNSIFFGNGPEGWTGCSCAVSGSPTISNNVFDIVPGDYASVNVAGDPLFTNAATGDFTISSSTSPACGYAVPIADVTTDIAGATRSATAPTCGAYEFGGSPVEPEEPEAPTLGAVTVTPKTTSATVSGSITSVGNNGATECDVYLALNGAAATKLGTSAAGAFGYTVSGLTAETEYSYTLSISNNATTVMGADTSGSFTTTAAPSGLQPSGDTTGATDRQSIQSAIDAAAAESPAGTVTLGEGTFVIDAQLNVTGGVTLVGQGADKTVIEPLNGGAIRCLFVDGEATVADGIMIRNGKSAASGGGVSMVSGTVRNCCITNCQVTAMTTFGGGVYMIGGTVEGCEIVGCKVGALYGRGNAVYVDGGTVTDCDIHHNDGGYSHSSLGCGEGIVYVLNGTLQNSKIHDNTKDSLPGVYQKNGTIVNCLVCNNRGKYHSAGIYKDKNASGTVYHCTVYNCLIDGDTDGNSGLHQESGSTKNCIVWGCQPSGSTAGGVKVSGGTFEYNVVDVVPSGYTDNVSGDPLFTNAENADFTISSADSPACGYGTPISAVTTDILGVARSATAPTCGAYEFGGSPVEPEAPTLGEVTVTPKATSATVSGSITSVGNNGATECDVYLALNGAAATKLGTSAAGPFSYSVSGLTAETEYSYTLSISNNATTAMGVETSGSFTTTAAPSGLQPSGDTTGATDRQSIQSAIDAAAAESPAGTVTLGEGTFVINAQLNVTGGVTLVGQGWDETVVTAASGKRITLVAVDDGAKAEGVTLTGGVGGHGGGAHVIDGTISWCCITNNSTGDGTGSNVSGAGVSFSGGKGKVDHCVIANNRGGNTCWGAGVGATAASAPSTSGTVVIDTCLIYGNTMTGSYGSGGGVGFKLDSNDVIIRNCTIADNADKSAGVKFEDSTGLLSLTNTILVDNMKGADEVNISANMDNVELVNCVCVFNPSAPGGDPKNWTCIDCFAGDPLFIGSGDYHLAEGSMAIGAGVTCSGIGQDLDGVTFADPPSIGCYDPHGGFVEPVFEFPAARTAKGTLQHADLVRGATSAEVSFAYGLESGDLGTPILVDSAATAEDTLVVNLNDLDPSTTYRYRITATDDGDPASTHVYAGTFTTPDWNVLALGMAKVSDVSASSARPSVELKNLGAGATSARVTLSWGESPTALTESMVLSESAQAGDTLGETIEGLAANTEYFYAFTAVNNASSADSVTVTGSFWTSDTSISAEDRSAGYPASVPSGKVVTYDADRAGDPVTFEPGQPFCLVNETGYPYVYTSTVGDGCTYAFRDETDFRYNASARIGGTYYLFLSDAVDAVKRGDTIELLRDNYALGETMEISTRLTIRGNGFTVKVAHPFMDAQGFVDTNCTEEVKTVFHIANGGDVRLENMTIMGGGERLGSGESGSNDATTPAITVCKDVNGGNGQAGSTGILEMDHVTITRSQGGLFIADGVKVYVDACNLVRNTRCCGGGLYNHGLLVMINSSLSENRSLFSTGGGAAAENQGSLFVNNCVVCNNASTEYGGALNMLANATIHDYQNSVAYLMNVTLSGNITSGADRGGGIGIHNGSDELYMVNCILCNNYYYNTNSVVKPVTPSDIRVDCGANWLYYSVYGAVSETSLSPEAVDFQNCQQVSESAQDVFKGYSPFVRTYEQNKKTSVEITAPALENDANQPLARYAPLLPNGAADVGTDGVYTYFDASNWREWTDSLDVSAIKMSYRTEGGEMTALGKCEPAEESDKVTTYYETAFNPNVVDRELGVVGASGFGNEKRSFTLYLLRQPENGSVNRELTLQGTSYLEGSEVTVVATPNAACSFVGWYDENDVLVSASASYTFTMDGDKKLYALFTPPSPTRTLYVDCEQAVEGTHGKFPITITTNWLASAFGSICPGGIVPDEKVGDVEEALNAADAVNGLNHVWQNYVLGLQPRDPDGRIWIRADQTRDASTLRLRTQTFSQTKDCGFTVAYRLLKKSPTEADFVRGDTYSSSASFDAQVTSDTLAHRVIDMIFIPDGYDTSCEYVTTVNTAGVMKVSSSKNAEIIAAPWCGFSPTDNPAVKATDYAKASCLAEGDVLYVYDRENQNYLAWAVQQDGTWKAVKTYNLVNGVVTESAADATRTNAIPRGTGVWLERHDTTKPIYLYGQVDDSPVTTSLAPGFNLVANPCLTAFDASKLTRPATTGEDGDRIVIPTGGAPINCTYDPDKGWGWLDYVEQELKNKKGEPILDPFTKEPLTGVTAVWKSEGMTLPVGHGFWYYNGGTTDGEIGWPSSQEDAQ